MKIALGTFACRGVEAHLGSDLVAGVRVALADYAERLDSGSRAIGMPPLPSEAKSASSQPAIAVDLSLDEKTQTALEREAARQGTTVSELATHSVLLYLAELDRMMPLSVV